MAIPSPIVIRKTADGDLESFVVGTDPTEIPNTTMAIVINSPDVGERTTSSIGTLTKCHDQLQTVLAEYKGAAFLNVGKRLSDSGETIFNDTDNTVPADYAAVVVGSLFGQDTTYGVGGGALLAGQSHNIDKVFKQLIGHLKEQDRATI